MSYLEFQNSKLKKEALPHEFLHSSAKNVLKSEVPVKNKCEDEDIEEIPKLSMESDSTNLNFSRCSYSVLNVCPQSSLGVMGKFKISFEEEFFYMVWDK